MAVTDTRAVHLVGMGLIMITHPRLGSHSMMLHHDISGLASHSSLQQFLAEWCFADVQTQEAIAQALQSQLAAADGFMHPVQVRQLLCFLLKHVDCRCQSP